MSDSADPEREPAATDALPEARIVPRRAWGSWAWLAPAIALVAVAALAYQAIRERGLPIQITFANGRGISANDPVNCRGVQVGVVERVRLDGDLQGVIVSVRLFPDSEPLAAEGTQYWIVRPEVSLKGVTGLDALLGPRYIEVAPAEVGSPRKTRFEGLESPPPIGKLLPGTLEIVLQATRRGSVTIGAPVTYRDMRVGRVIDVRLSPDSTRVEVLAAIEPAFVPLVRDNSQFWNASGVGVDFGLFGGLTLRADSLESILTGGVAFATPDKKTGDPVHNGHVFELAAKAEDEWLTWEPSIALDADSRGAEP
ncbi:MAG: MCE family protein [Phycisphaerales bacterium]|nr:MCE family protein [Phycisphaerales bacterium]